VSDVLTKINIPNGKYCKDCGFLMYVPTGYCFLYGYLRYYSNEEKSYERDNICKMDCPNGATLLLVKEEK
jgi:hypothetical protein